MPDLPLNTFAVIVFFCGCCAISMGILVFGRNPKSRVNILFLLQTLTIFFWGLQESLFLGASTSYIAHLWHSIGSPWTLTVAVFFHFTMTFAENKKLSGKRIFLFPLAYGPAALFILLRFFGLDADSVTRQSWGWHFEALPSPYYFIVNAWALSLTSVSVFMLIRFHNRLDDNAKRRRTAFLLWSMFLTLSINITTEMVLPLLSIRFPRMAMPSFALGCAIIGLGMWKYRLFSFSPAAATDSIINTMSDGLFLVGMDKKIKMINASAGKMLEYDTREIVGQPIDILFSQTEKDVENLSKHGTGFRGLIKTVIKGDVETVFVSKSGGRIPVSLSGSLIRDTENDLMGIVCIARDISERQKQRDSLSQSDERYKLLVENMPLGVISVDSGGNIIDANPKLAEILDAPSVDAIRSLNMLTSPHLIETGTADDMRRCLTEKCQVISERSNTSSWGKSGFLRYHFVPRVDSEGRIVGAQGIVEDISQARKNADALKQANDELENRVRERTSELTEANKQLSKIAEERLEEQRLLAIEKEQLDVTLRSIAEGVIAADINGKIVLMNRAAELLTGYDIDEARGKLISEICPTSDAAGAGHFGDIAFKAMTSCETIIQTKPSVLVSRSGAERIISQNAAPIRGRSGAVTGVVLALADVTEKQRLEDELFRTRRFESIGALAGGIAHDFNNILTGIITNLFVAKMQLDKNSEVFSLIAESEHAAFKASGLTNQLQAFSRKTPSVKSVISLKDLIEDSVGFFLSGSAADYQLDCDEEPWKTEIDRSQIDQAVHSIISNSAKRMPGGGIISIRIENIENSGSVVPSLKNGRYVKVTISDEGEPLTEEDADRFFEPYVNHGGSYAGLEMAAAYAIVRKHDGHIAVSSNAGRGISVSIFVPAITEEEDAKDVQSGEHETPAKDSASRRLRILLMDDEEMIRNSGKRLLSALGYEAETCADGESAVSMYRDAMNQSRPFDAVILDYTVPGGAGGREAMEKIISMDPEARGILCSGYSSEDIFENCRKSGFTYYLSKPYVLDELEKAIESVISG